MPHLCCCLTLSLIEPSHVHTQCTGSAEQEQAIWHPSEMSTAQQLQHLRDIFPLPWVTLDKGDLRQTVGCLTSPSNMSGDTQTAVFQQGSSPSGTCKSAHPPTGRGHQAAVEAQRAALKDVTAVPQAETAAAAAQQAVPDGQGCLPAPAAVAYFPWRLQERAEGQLPGL